VPPCLESGLDIHPSTRVEGGRRRDGFISSFIQFIVQTTPRAVEERVTRSFPPPSDFPSLIPLPPFGFWFGFGSKSFLQRYFRAPPLDCGSSSNPSSLSSPPPLRSSRTARFSAIIFSRVLLSL